VRSRWRSCWYHNGGTGIKRWPFSGFFELSKCNLGEIFEIWAFFGGEIGPLTASGKCQFPWAPNYFFLWPFPPHKPPTRFLPQKKAVATARHSPPFGPGQKPIKNRCVLSPLPHKTTIETQTHICVLLPKAHWARVSHAAAAGARRSQKGLKGHSRRDAAAAEVAVAWHPYNISQPA
jgi:hypothetical protein